MKKKVRKAKTMSAEAIARLAERGKDVSHFFADKGRMILAQSTPIPRGSSSGKQ